MSKPIVTVSFDFGGTLAHDVKKDYEVYHEILDEMGYRFEPVEVESAYRKAVEWWRMVKRKENLVWNEDSQRMFISRMLAHLGLEEAEEFVECILEVRRGKRLLKPYSDAEPTVRRLKEMGFKLIVISNVSSERNLSAYLTQVGLRGYFSLLFASGSLGVEKPNSEIFLYASRVSGTPPDMMVHIGDDYEADYLGAEKAGLKAILIDRANRYAGQRCTRVKSLLQVPELLEEFMK
ncbi:HAD-IA family hydrolase [Candidatus Bathyarchaeota archaeon]|nr:HAD-IA family hydrolase [Candidatus Bathyarchaeota archaeon]